MMVTDLNITEEDISECMEASIDEVSHDSTEMEE